jgi:hypothetical protein
MPVNPLTQLQSPLRVAGLQCRAPLIAWDIDVALTQGLQDLNRRAIINRICKRLPLEILPGTDLQAIENFLHRSQISAKSFLNQSFNQPLRPSRIRSLINSPKLFTQKLTQAHSGYRFNHSPG